MDSHLHVVLKILMFMHLFICVFCSCMVVVPVCWLGNCLEELIFSYHVRLRGHAHGDSFKGKHLIGACLQFQRFSPLL